MHMTKTKVVNESQKRNYLERVEAKRQSINQCIDTLRAEGIELTTIEQVKAVSPDWLRSYIDAAKNEYFGGITNFVPNSIRQQNEQEFEQVYTTCQPVATHLNTTLSNITEYGYYLDRNGTFWFNTKDINAAAEKAATRVFSPLEREYYSKLGDVIDAVAALHKWEKGNGFVAISEELLSHIIQKNLTQEEYIHYLDMGRIGVKRELKDFDQWFVDQMKDINPNVESITIRDATENYPENS